MSHAHGRAGLLLLSIGVLTAVACAPSPTDGSGRREVRTRAVGDGEVVTPSGAPTRSPGTPFPTGSPSASPAPSASPSGSPSPAATSTPSVTSTPLPTATPTPPAANATIGLHTENAFSEDLVSAIVDYGDAGQLRGVRWVPATARLTWKVTANATEVKIKGVRLAFESVGSLRVFRLLQEATPVPSVAPTGIITPPPDSNSGGPQIVLESPPEAWPTLDVIVPGSSPTPGIGGSKQAVYELSPADLAFPVTFAKGSTTVLALDLSAGAVTKFISEQRPLDQVEISLNLVDEGGALVPDGNAPLFLRGRFTVK